MRFHLISPISRMSVSQSALVPLVPRVRRPETGPASPSAAPILLLPTYIKRVWSTVACHLAKGRLSNRSFQRRFRSNFWTCCGSARPSVSAFHSSMALRRGTRSSVAQALSLELCAPREDENLAGTLFALTRYMNAKHKRSSTMENRSPTPTRARTSQRQVSVDRKRCPGGWARRATANLRAAQLLNVRVNDFFASKELENGVNS